MTTTETALLSAATGLTGVFIGHYFSNYRDGKTRRLQFVEFLGKWLSEIGRVTGKDTAATYTAYMHRIHEFNGHDTKITGDIYWRRSRFVRLTEEFASLLSSHINNDAGDCRDVVVRRIREFIRITR